MQDKEHIEPGYILAPYVIKTVATYINGEKWNDEVSAPRQSMATPLPTQYTVSESGEF